MNEEIENAVQALLCGGVVIFPTDTVYGIAAHPDFPDAVRRLYEIKGRVDTKPIAFLADSYESVVKYGAVFSKKAERLARRFWPGALTIITPANGIMEGFRVPNFDISREILRQVGGLLRVTSANPSGSPDADRISAPSIQVVAKKCDAVIDAGTLPVGTASTVIKVEGDDISILREGSITKEMLFKEIENVN